jgi:hypothetical protein
MRRTCLLALAVLTLVAGCTGNEPEPEPVVDDAEATLFDLAAENLPDTLLESTVPEGYDLTKIVRHGFEQTNNEWITVGSRLEGPTGISRAIFYVLPSEAAASNLNTGQIEHTEQDYRAIQEGFSRYKGRIPRPFEVEGSSTSATCGVRIDNLIWCHSQKGRFYLLIQTPAGTFGKRSTITAEQLDAARDVTSTYADLL